MTETMRTLCPYLLAALAASLVELGVLVASPGALLEKLTAWMVSVAGLFVLMSAAWILAGWFAAALRLTLTGRAAILRGVVAAGLFALTGFMLAAAGLVSLRGDIAWPGLDAGGLGIALVYTVLAGALWGAVFWLRAPQSQTAGYAA